MTALLYIPFVAGGLLALFVLASAIGTMIRRADRDAATDDIAVPDILGPDWDSWVAQMVDHRR